MGELHPQLNPSNIHHKIPQPRKKTMLKFSMKKNTTRVAAILLSITIIISAPTTNHAFHATQIRNCSYSIEIETTCARSAETTDPISLRFSDSSGNLVIMKHLSNPKLLYAPKPKGLKRQGGAYRGFERCVVDMFEATGVCMKERVCSLYLKRYGPDGWRPGWVKVLHQQDSSSHAVPVSYVFYFRTFVPENVWFGFDYCQSKGGFIPHVASFGGD